MDALGDNGLSAVAAKILELDPEGKYVKLDTAQKTVEYTPEIESGEQISSYEGEEEPCRAFIVAWLCTTGGYLPGNLALERRYSIGRPKTGAELDILVLRPNGTPFAMIEVKSPVEYEIDQNKYIQGQLFNIAPLEPGTSVLAYATVSTRESSAEIICKSIDYAQYPTFAEWAASPAFSNSLPTNYGEPVHVHLTKDGERDLNRQVTLAELRRVQRRLHDVLWRGSTPDNKIYDQVIKLFLAKSHDEKTTRSGEQYRFQIRYPGGIRENPDEVFENVSALFKDAYRKYLNLPRDAEVEGLNSTEFSAEQTAFVVELLQDISLVQAAGNADVLGSFFEGITREGFKQTKGLFFTHGNVVTFLIHALNLGEFAAEKVKSDSLASDKLPYIIDPSCGSGTFLLGSMTHITKYVTEKRRELSVNDDTKNFLNQQFLAGQENAWAGTFLYGLDAAQTLAISTKVNMLLRQDGQAHIYNVDGLAPLSSYADAKLRGRPHADPRLYSKDVAETFDVVVSNPPFSITLDPQTTRTLTATFELAGSANSENLFLERWYQLLKPKGRLGVVLPESFFSTKENLSARLFLFSHFNVKAIVSLPKEAFEPWTPTRTSLLFAEKKTIDEERAWINASIRFESRGSVVRAAGLAAIRKVARDTKNLLGQDTKEKVAGHWATLDEVGYGPVALPDDYTLAMLRNTLEQWRANLPTTSVSREVSKAKTFVIATLKRISGIETSMQKYRRALRFFDYGESVLQPMNKAWSELEGELVAGIAQFTRLDVRVWAFRRVAEKQTSAFYSAATDNIGYRRTKRGEAERPNDLFYACEVGDVSKRVLDTDLSTSPWEVRLNGGTDLLNQLRPVLQWSEI